MGFSGGGSSVTKPHTHDSTILQDGGNLDFKNITQSDMSASSMTYSDGVHLQELAIGSAGETLSVTGGVPTWAAGAVPTGTVVLDDHTAVGTASTYTFTPASPLLSSKYSKIEIVFNVALSANLTALQMLVSGNTTYYYYANFNYQDSTTNSWTDSTRVGTGSTSYELASATFSNTSDGLVGSAEILWGTPGGSKPIIKAFASQTSPIMWEEHTGLSLNASSGSISSITFQTATTWIAGSNFIIYGVLR